MSPFALYIKKLRKQRALKQIELADLLGYEPSYIGALERSEKGPPRQDFVRRLIQGLALNSEEQTELANALSKSKRHFSLPPKSSEAEYRLLRVLERQLGKLHPIQIQFIELALSLPGQCLCQGPSAENDVIFNPNLYR